MTDAAIKSLQRVAWFTNRHLGGGCCEDHARQNEKLLLDELGKFEDDSFEALKPEFEMAELWARQSAYFDRMG